MTNKYRLGLETCRTGILQEVVGLANFALIKIHIEKPSFKFLELVNTFVILVNIFTQYSVRHRPNRVEEVKYLLWSSTENI